VVAVGSTTFLCNTICPQHYTASQRWRHYLHRSNSPCRLSYYV